MRSGTTVWTNTAPKRIAIEHGSNGREDGKATTGGELVLARLVPVDHQWVAGLHPVEVARVAFPTPLLRVSPDAPNTGVVRKRSWLLILVAQVDGLVQCRLEGGLVNRHKPELWHLLGPLWDHRRGPRYKVVTRES